MFDIRPITNEFRTFVDAHIAENWAGPFIATCGKLHDTRTHDGFVAVSDDEVVGYILYNIAENNCEITVLESLRQKQGIGSTLLEAVRQNARKAGCKRIWLITTNDNTPAIRYYQRYGFNLRAVHINAVASARELKPQIPLVGLDNIPIVHEFEFEMGLE